MKNKQTTKEKKTLKLEKFQVSEIKDQNKIIGGKFNATGEDTVLYWPI